MNKGLIVGCVRYGEGNGKKSNTVYEGAIVTLRHIFQGGNRLIIRDAHRKGDFYIDPQVTDKNGCFSIPFLWEGHQIGDYFNDARYTIVAIDPGDKNHNSASKVIAGRLKFGSDMTRLITMIPEGVAVKIAGELIKKSMLKSFRGIENIASLAGNATKHASPENIKAVGKCEIWL